MDLGSWTAPEGHRIERFHDRRSRNILSLEAPRQLPSSAPRGRDARDLRFYDSSVPHPAVGLTPNRMFRIFREAELGYPQLQVDLFNDLVEGDGTARNLFEHRERVVANKPCVFTAGDNTDEGKTAAAVMTYVWARLNGREMLEHALRFNRHGYSGVELIWDILELEGRPWVVPVGFNPVMARRFRVGTMGMFPVTRAPYFETEVRLDDLRLYERYEESQGSPLRPGKWLTLRNATSEVARSGLMRTGALYMMAKRFSFRDWIVLSEKFGIPLPIATYTEQTQQAGLEVAQQIVQRIGNDGGAAIPEGIKVEVVEGVKAEHPLQAALIGYCNAELGKLVNGSTLRNDTKDSSGASYALGNIHDQVAWDEVRRDGSFASEAITLQICAAFCRFNALKCEAPTAQIIVEPDLGPIEATSLMVKGKNELGIDVSKTQWRQLTGMREPIDDDDKAPGMIPDIKFTPPAGGVP